jgi:hypothetical protein
MTVFKRLHSIPLLAGLLIFVFAIPGLAQTLVNHPVEDSSFPSLVSAIRVKGPISFAGEPVPLDIPDVREKLEKELLLMLWDRAQVILWLKRTGRYFPQIEAILAKSGLPDDLKYVAVIESALKPHAGSTRGARGIWQFIPSTARYYGLTVGRYVDERRNFQLSTDAAVEYFSKLREECGSWALACAAYNMGEKGLEQRVDHQGVKDYYRLDLPTETERYVLRAVAAKLILSDPGRYGFHLEQEDYYTSRAYERVVLKHNRAVPITVVAEAAGTYYKAIRDLNPQLLGDTIPKGKTTLFLPEGATKAFERNFTRLLSKHRAKHRPMTYTVKHGDSLTVIAERHNMSLWQLLQLNGLGNRSVIHPGQLLIIAR